MERHILENLPELYRLTGNGLYALINDQDRLVDVRYGIDLLRSISNVLTSIKDHSVVPIALATDFNKLELKILETNIQPTSLKLKHKYWQEHYKATGYSLYRTMPGNSYNLFVLLDLVPGMGSSYYFIVKLVRQDRELVVGIFDNNTEMEEFLEIHYPRKLVLDIVYSTNSLTSSYRNL